MFPSTFILSTLLAVAGVVNAGDHFVLTRISSLALARIDPIVNPGKVSGHVHNIMGGSCFNQNPNTPEQQQDCDCSSVIIGDDRSNYWAPALYYQSPEGKVQPILSGARTYYFLKGDVKPFPTGLRMITGSAMTRNASDTKAFGIKISCNHEIQTQWLPNGTSHPGGCTGIAMGIFFPSCGLASGDLDSEDHFSHMAWPITVPGGGMPPFDNANAWQCPDSHPIKYPTMFMEANYYLSEDQKWHSGNPLILSNGDESGLTYHADFSEGWEPQLLKDTIEQCGNGKAPGDQLMDCAPLAKSMSEQDTWGCRFQGEIPNEDIGLYRPLDALPGCNLKWPVDGPDTKPACKEENPPDFIYPNAQFVNLQYRERVPMVFTLASNVSDQSVMDDFVPALGAESSSSIKIWGLDGSNRASLKLSTVAEIEASQAGQGNSSDPDPAPASSSSSEDSTSTSTATSSAKSPNSSASAATKSVSASQSAISVGAGVALAGPPSSSSAAVHTSSVSGTNLTTHPEATGSSSAGGSKPTAGSGKVCKRKNRGLVKRAQEVSKDLRGHLDRRSRRALLHH